MTITQFADFEMQRAEGYRLLAALFYQPELEMYRENNIFPHLLTIAHAQAPEAVAPLNALEAALRNVETEEALLVEYAALFVGPGKLLAAPYGSIYLDDEKLLMGDSTLEVIKTYREHGLAIDNEFHCPPDHITVELEFMYFLLHKEATALHESDIETAKKYLATSESFLQANLLKWVPQFAEDIITESTVEYYRLLGQALQAYVSSTAWKAHIPESL